MLQNNAFYAEHKLSVAAYLQTANRVIINYISSPEIGFLKSISGQINKGRTKLIFEFKELDATEPTINKKYSAILQDLASIKVFASGILVPKEYIWPVDANRYLKPATTLVADAHKLGLEVYASGFANDKQASYNYSYNPVAEYLQFIDTSQFAVDGLVTDFPPTASEAVGKAINSHVIPLSSLNGTKLEHIKHVCIYIYAFDSDMTSKCSLIVQHVLLNRTRRIANKVSISC